ARGAGRGDSAHRRGDAPRGCVVGPGIGGPGRGRARPSGRSTDRSGRYAGVPRHLQRPAQGLLRPPAPGWAGREGGGADRDRPRGGAFARGRSRAAPAVRERRRDAGGERRVCDQRAVPGREARAWAVFNRMSPSAYLRGHGNAIFYTLHYLAYLKRHDVPVINGYDAYVTETSKALQLSLLHHLGLPYPRARVINHPARAPEAAQGFRFPVIVKPNIGGSGAGIRRFETPQQLEQAAGAGALDLGIDQTALVQEYIPAAEQRIVRVEVLGGRYLYAIRIYTPGDSFNLCPADVCQTVGGAELV